MKIKPKKSLIIFLSLLCAVCVTGMVLALTLGRKTVVRFTPPPFDSAAVAGSPAGIADASYGEIDATAYKFSLCGEPTVKDGAALLWFTNPDSNDVLLKLRILDASGALLGESGLLRPGEYVQSAALPSPPAGSTEVALVIMAYEPETYHSMGNVTLSTQLIAES